MNSEGADDEHRDSPDRKTYSQTMRRARERAQWAKVPAPTLDTLSPIPGMLGEFIEPIAFWIAAQV